MTELKELEAKVLALPPELRAELAQRLLASLDQSEEEENERLWLEAALQRYKGYQADTIPARDAFVALDEVRNKIR